MNFVQDPRCNAVLGAPAGVPIEECRALPILRGQMPNGEVVCQSFWMPTPEELKALNEGKPVIFTSWGVTHAPIMLAVEVP